MAAFATAADLPTWLSADAVTQIGEDAARILARASAVVAEAATSGWPIDTAGLPALTEHRDALRDATLAQVEQWLEVGEENDTAGYPRSTSMGANGMTLSALPTVLAPRARRILRAAGLSRAVAY